VGEATKTDSHRAPAWRTAIIRGVLAAAALVIAWRMIGWAIGDSPARVDYEAALRELLHSNQGEGTNGYPDLTEAVRRTQDYSSGLFQSQELSARPKDCSANPHVFDFNAPFFIDPLDMACYGIERSVIQRCEELGINALIDSAAGADFIAREVDDVLVDSNDPISLLWERFVIYDLGALRKLAFVYVVAMRFAIHDGDEDAFIDSLRRALTLQRASAQQFIIVEHAAASATARLAFTELMMQLQERAFRAVSLAEIAELIGDDRIRPDIRRAVAGESIFKRDVVQWVYTDDSQRSTALNLSRLKALEGSWPVEQGEATPMASFGGALFESRRQTLSRLDEFDAELKRYVELSANAQRNDPFHPESSMLNLPVRQPVLRLLATPWVRTITAEHTALQQIDAANIMVAIERFRAATGGLPPDLNALVPAYLDALPMDVITGGPFMYARTTQLRNGYALWSPGLDGTDQLSADLSAELSGATTHRQLLMPLHDDRLLIPLRQNTAPGSAP
jgi:hypothetical protein